MIASAREPDPHPAPLLVSAAEAARMLQISEATLRRLSAPRGPIPCIKLRSGSASKGGQARFVSRYRPSDLQVWIESQLVLPVAEASSPPG